MLSNRLVVLSLFIFFTVFLVSAADPPFLFPHGYFDSSKLKPFDAIYLNLMAQSNLEYGGITLEELDKLAASHRYVPWPSYLPRTRVEDDVLLYRVPMSDTDGIAPGPKSNDSDHAPSRPFSTVVNEIISTSGGRASREGVAALKTSRPSSSGFTLTAPEPGSPLAKPMRSDGRAANENTGAEAPSKKPPSPFRLIRRLQRRIRRASDVDEENPFEDIATRAPPRDQMQLQLVRKMLRQSRHRKKKHRFLTRDDIYDPQRERMTHEDRRILREELALKPESHENQDDIMGDDVTKTPSRESVGERHLRRPQQAPTEEKFETDLRTTPTPSHLPTLVPNIDYAPRLRNNPFARLDIRKPTVVQLPIPPKIGEAFEE